MSASLTPPVARIVWLDAAVCLSTGLVLAVANTPIAGITAIPAGLVLWSGLLLLPIAEIAGFILVGRWLGLLPTLLLIVLLTMAGAALLRIQGLGALRRLGQNDGAEAGRQIVHGALIVVAGILLIIPGFITGATLSANGRQYLA